MNTPTLPLTTDPSQHPYVFAAAFNSGDAELVESVYEPDGVLVARPGQEVSGRDRRAANEKLMALGVPIQVHPRHTFVSGDVALLVVDWNITGLTTDGAAIDIRGTATDVARRGTDGWWRYVIDNPWGVSSP